MQALPSNPFVHHVIFGVAGFFKQLPKGVLHFHGFSVSKMNDFITVNAIVLRAVDYKEFDRILTIYSLEHGKLSANAAGVKKPKAKLKHAAQPLVFGEFDLMPTKAGHRLMTARPIDTFFDIHKNIEAYFAAAAVLELADIFATETADPQLFLLVVNTVKDLTYGTRAAKDITAEFLTEFLKISGYGVQENASLRLLALRCEEHAERKLKALSAFLSMAA